jgi:oligosaccharide repeat unit polymerase
MLRKLIFLFFLPPVLIGFFSLAPFAIDWSDYLSAKALYASRTVGFDPIAFGYACVCVGAFGLVYFFVSSRFRHGERRQVVLRHPRHAKRLVLGMVGILAVVGLGVTVFTVTTGGSGYVNEMARRLIAGEIATDVLYNSQGYIFSESVPGLIRMLGGWSNAAVLVWLSLATPPWRDLLKKMYWPGLVLLLAANFVRGVLGGDRGPALVAFLLTAYVALTQIRKAAPRPMRKGRSLRTRGMALGLVIIVGVGLWAYTRLDKLRNPGDYNTILFYSDMGVGNLSLAMKTGQGMGYGYYTLAGPLSVVFRYLGMTVAWPQFTADTIEEGPFYNLLGYTYADLGLFGFVIYGFFGLLSGWVYLNIRRYPSHLVWRVTHLHILWALSSAFTVPIFTGPSYWAGLLGAIGVSYLLDRHRYIYTIPASVFPCVEKVST